MKRYLQEFVKLNCAVDLLALKLFPNAKEITESMAAFRGVMDIIANAANLKANDPNVVLVSVGDGVTPRTAALFAFRTEWRCWSVDPLLRMEKHYEINHLYLAKDKIEDVNLDFSDRPVVIVCVHSHAKMKDILAHIHGKSRHLLTIPCCEQHTIPNKVYFGYTDDNIWSEKREVKIWMNI